MLNSFLNMGHSYVSLHISVPQTWNFWAQSHPNVFIVLFDAKEKRPHFKGL